MSYIKVYRFKRFECVLILSNCLYLYKLIYDTYLLLCMVIIGNYVHNTCSFFSYLLIEKPADSNLCKCLKAIQCSESRVETLQILCNGITTRVSVTSHELFFRICFRKSVPILSLSTLPRTSYVFTEKRKNFFFNL